MWIKKNVTHILIRGGGELATGIAHKFFNCGFKVIINDLANPMAVRRGACFSESVNQKKITIEGVTAQLSTFDNWQSNIDTNKIPVLIEPYKKCLFTINPQCIIDATMRKKVVDTSIKDAKIVLGIGPGFYASKNVHAVIETNRSHNLGKVIYTGEAQKNTGIPALVKGYSLERVIWSKIDGKFLGLTEIGQYVKKGQVLAKINKEEIVAKIDGVIRGLIANNYVLKGQKVIDIDPGEDGYYKCFTISDKARCIAGGVLEAYLKFINKNV